MLPKTLIYTDIQKSELVLNIQDSKSNLNLEMMFLQTCGDHAAYDIKAKGGQSNLCVYVVCVCVGGGGVGRGEKGQ